MAFHPQYASNGYFFLYYTDLIGNIVIERRQVSAGNPNVADALASVQIIAIPHPGFSNHNGGLLSFGPDGYLYAATGDGGGAGDPSGNAQNTNLLLGKMLRLDVNASSIAQPYAIPASNPFVNTAGKRAEIWAYGLRNPWRYAFDTTAQLLYIADVGQGQREEINVAPVGTAGNNYGWNIMEGTQCYNSATLQPGGAGAAQGRVRPRQRRRLFDHGRLCLPRHGAAGTGRPLSVFRLLQRLAEEFYLQQWQRLGRDGLEHHERGQYPVVRPGCAERTVHAQQQRQGVPHRAQVIAAGGFFDAWRGSG